MVNILNKHFTNGWNTERFWRACVLNWLTHALMLTHYPMLSHEHSWDGINYSVQNSGGKRGTITFADDGICIAAFRDDNCDRDFSGVEALQFFNHAPQEVIDIASTETLQYLLNTVNGEDIPVITSAFWTNSYEIFSNSSYYEMLHDGANLLRFQLMDYDNAIVALKAEYELTEKQLWLITHLYERKISNPDQQIVLTNSEVDMLGTSISVQGMEEAKEVLQELDIILP